MMLGMNYGGILVVNIIWLDNFNSCQKM